MAMTDLFVILLAVFALAIMILVGRTVWDMIVPSLQTNLKSPRAVSGLDTITDAFATLDPLFIFMAFGIGIAGIILASQIQSHPMFAFAGIIMIVIALLIAPALSNAFEKFGADTALTDALNAYPMMNLFMQNYPIYIMIVGFLIAIVMYGKVTGRSGA